MSRVEVKNLTYRYPYGVYALNNLCFSLENEIIAVVGNIESGKSTLLRVLAGLLDGYSGNIITDIDDKKSILYVPDRDLFFNNKSVYYNLSYPLKIRNIDEREIERRIKNVAKEFCIERILDAKIKNISNADKVNVAYSRLFLRDANLYLIDDYFEILDENIKYDFIKNLSKKIKDINKTTIIAVDSIDKALMFTDKILVLEYGIQHTFNNFGNTYWCSSKYCAEIGGEQNFKVGKISTVDDKLCFVAENFSIDLDENNLCSKSYIGKNVIYSDKFKKLFDITSEKTIYF